MIRNRKQAPPKELWTFMKPEDVEAGVEYAMNISPEMQPPLLQLLGFQDWYQTIYLRLRGLKNSTYELNLEISSQGRFHFHGLVRVKNVMGFYMFDVKSLKSIGGIKMTKIDNIDGWSAYRTKQEKFIKPFLEKEGLPLLLSTFTQKP